MKKSNNIFYTCFSIHIFKPHYCTNFIIPDSHIKNKNTNSEKKGRMEEKQGWREQTSALSSSSLKCLVRIKYTK